MIELNLFERWVPLEYNQLFNLRTIDTPFLVPDHEESFISFYNGERIFRKSFSFQELLGEEIATFMERDTIHYFLLLKENVFYLASFPFLDQKECYPDDLKEDILYAQNKEVTDEKNFIPFFLEQSKTREMRESFLITLYQTFAIDTYMRQTDRCSCNSMLYQENSNLLWAPMYDYNFSFGSFESIKEVLKSFNYQNPFFSMTLRDYSTFLELYPDFLNYLKQIQTLDFEKILLNIKDKYCFSYTEDFLSYWKRQEEVSQRVIQKIIQS